ncbi:MAG TPA: Calx-beta domain-containing protein [Gaiellaceae bacterium]|nr:Calx-beta domain-containing protein [Gaiellaceae bacterium]
MSVGDAGAVPEGQNAIFRISLDAVATSDVSVGFNLGGTASVADHGPAPTTALIPRGQSYVDVMVPTVADTLDENDETLALNLQTSPVALAKVTGSATIVDDDTASIAVADVSRAEGTGPGTTRYSFEIVMKGASSTDVSVAWSTSPGTAITPDDFASAGGTVSWPAGRDGGAKAVSVEVARDALAEDDETFGLALTGPTGIATIADGAATGTIVDDDSTAPGAATGPPTLSIADVRTAEGAGSLDLTVTRAGSTSHRVTVRFSGSSGTGAAPASPGTDFILAAGALTFEPGETTRTISVGIVQDAAAEADETFQVALADAAPSGTVISRPTAVVTIVDDDSTAPAAPVLRVSIVPTPAPRTVPIARSAPPPVGPAQPQARKPLRARVLSTRLLKSTGGRRRAAIRVTLNQRVTARLVFTQRRRVIRSAPFALTAGNRTVIVILPGSTRRGRVDLRLQLATSTGGGTTLRTKLLLQA